MQASSSNRTKMFSMIDSWKASGLSQKAFCKQHDIRYFVFHYWYRVYRDERAEQKGKQPAFVPVRIESPKTPSAVMELVLLDGKRLLFHHQPSLDFLKALL